LFIDHPGRKIYSRPLDIVFEDDFLAIVNKPGGLSVSGNFFANVQNALPFNLKKCLEKDRLPRPLPVHRLDRDTCGLLLVAKTRKTRIHLGTQFENRLIKKKYKAIVIGKTENSGEINSRIKDQEAITHYRTMRTVHSLFNGHLSLLEINLITGRTHQIRIHLSKSGFPILGDRLYGEEGKILRGKGLFLCSTTLEFIHPVSNIRQVVTITEPAKFNTLLDRENRRWLKYQ